MFPSPAMIASLTLSAVRYDHDYEGYPPSENCEYSIVRASFKHAGPAGAQVRDERRKLLGWVMSSAWEVKAHLKRGLRIRCVLKGELEYEYQQAAPYVVRTAVGTVKWWVVDAGMPPTAEAVMDVEASTGSEEPRQTIVKQTPAGPGGTVDIGKLISTIQERQTRLTLRSPNIDRLLDVRKAAAPQSKSQRHDLRT